MAINRNSRSNMITAIAAGANATIITGVPGYRIVVTSITQGIGGGIGFFATVAAFGLPLWTVHRSPAALAPITLPQMSAPERDTPIFVLDPGDGLLFNYTLGTVGALADAGATWHFERAL